MADVTPARLVAGSRGSPLARWQTEWVIQQLKIQFPHTHFELQIIKTQGDKILDLPLHQIGDKGLFTKELEHALLAGQIDFAVHSLKDLPVILPDGLQLGAILERHDPHDVLVTPHARFLSELPAKALIGTGSLRRRTQLQQVRPDLVYQDLRGNIETRLEKLDRGDYQGIIMAKAALERLNLGHRITQVLPMNLMLPAVAQGVVAVECRAEDEVMQSVLQRIHHAATAAVAQAERAFLEALGGGCHVPIAAHASAENEVLHLYGLVAAPDGSQVLKAKHVGQVSQPAQLGRDLAAQLLEQGAAALLQDGFN